ncbi:hypothetical protein IRY61_05815 [Candidatus Saccharibacteria bacterium]|nr:hypothetical protein [Candidatus Saccharibacteria bacterium]
MPEQAPDYGPIIDPSKLPVLTRVGRFIKRLNAHLAATHVEGALRRIDDEYLLRYPGAIALNNFNTDQ